MLFKLSVRLWRAARATFVLTSTLFSRCASSFWRGIPTSLMIVTVTLFVLFVCLLKVSLKGEGSASGGDDDDDDSGMEASEDEDDKTWMVRRAAAKTITSLVVNHPEKLAVVIEKAGPELVKQFKERESCTRHEVLGSYVLFVFFSVFYSKKMFLFRYEALGAACVAAGRTSAASELFAKTADKAVVGLVLLLSHKSADTRIAAVSVLRSLGRFSPALLGSHIKQLVPGIGAAMTDSNSALRVNALELLREILLGCEAEVGPVLEALLAPLQKVLSSGGALHSRVATAALNACEAFLIAAAGKNDLLNKLYTSFEPLFKQTELDAEAKEAAIRAAARAICNLGTNLPSVNAALDILVERLGSELTREAASNAVAMIAANAINLNVAYLSKAVPILCSLCAPGTRSVKIAALTALDAVFEHNGEVLKLHSQVLNDSSALIDTDDFLLAQLAVRTAVAVLHSNPKCVADVKKVVYPRVHALLLSPLLEGLTLAALADLFRELSALDTKGFGFVELLSDLDGHFKTAFATKDHHVYRNLSACYAQVIVAASDSKKIGTAVQALVKRASSKDEEERIGAIYVLAEIGRQKDVSEYSGLVEVLADALDSPSRSVGLAASYALGSVAVGNLSKYLPFILADMKKNPKRQLLLLQAIKEIVSGQSGSSQQLRLSLSASVGGTAAQDIAVHLDTLLPILFEHAAAADDLTRNAVSECLGRLAKIAPEKIVGELENRAADKSHFARACMVNALRYAVTERASADLDVLLEKVHFFHFCSCLFLTLLFSFCCEGFSRGCQSCCRP
jgi:cullin-associated NEDD8-dissociated protein 1